MSFGSSVGRYSEFVFWVRNTSSSLMSLGQGRAQEKEKIIRNKYRNFMDIDELMS
jgi:hypothetical protein